MMLTVIYYIMILLHVIYMSCSQIRVLGHGFHGLPVLNA